MLGAEMHQVQNWLADGTTVGLPLAPHSCSVACLLLIDCWQDQGNDVKVKIMIFREICIFLVVT